MYTFLLQSNYSLLSSCKVNNTPSARQKKLEKKFSLFATRSLERIECRVSSTNITCCSGETFEVISISVQNNPVFFSSQMKSNYVPGCSLQCITRHISIMHISIMQCSITTQCSSSECRISSFFSPEAAAYKLLDQWVGGSAKSSNHCTL